MNLIIRRNSLKVLLVAPILMAATSVHAQSPISLRSSYATSAFNALIARATQMFTEVGTATITFLKAHRPTAMMAGITQIQALQAFGAALTCELS
ncbi:hypothetical protein CQ13_33700 [Bradyrhizobium retamae]|uniref:Uncharacterized protein n=2 Tax=Bradyrhizobium retamae TaxID=1300035 RepID=A0A0R3MGL5_9BRAD|nr:hypothetical protein CQ13_33700 [Bradyrhizobium retamae]